MLPLLILGIVTFAVYETTKNKTVVLDPKVLAAATSTASGLFAGGVSATSVRLSLIGQGYAPKVADAAIKAADKTVKVKL